MTITTIAAAEEPDDRRSAPQPNPFYRADLAQQHPPEEPDPQSEIARWREEARLAGLRARAAEEANRDLAIRTSGVDFDHPHGRLFLDALAKGAVTLTPNPTSEQVRGLAAEYGIPMRDES
jgi:hypothetical protein